MRSRDEVLRFHIWGNREGDTEVEVRADGEWVRHDDYAERIRELEALVDTLTARNLDLSIECDGLEDELRHATTPTRGSDE